MAETQSPERAGASRWTMAAVLTTAPLLVALCVTIWRAPYPISETVALLEGAGIMEQNASPSTLADPTFQSFFDPTGRSWYRPLYHATWYSLWHATGNLRSTLAAFKAIEVGALASLVLLFMWHLRPSDVTEYAAATFAAAVLIGMPALRENLEVPLLYTLVGMALIMLVWIVLQRDHRAWHLPVVLALTVLATGFKEQGLVIVPLVLGAWWCGARGARAGTALAVTVFGSAYLVFRLATRGSWGAFEQDFGFGFTTMSAAEASARYGSFPLPMYVYNTLSTLANVLFSEPSSGRFRITERLLGGQAEPWEIVQLLSSAALTVLVAWWGVSVWRRREARPWPVERQVLVAAVVTLAASAPLGFNYTRDRLGGMAAVFYAMAAYFAARHALRVLPHLRRGRLLAGSLVLLLLGAAWQLRAIGTLDAEHLRAMRIHKEWLTNLQRRRVEFAHNRTYLRILEDMTPQGVDVEGAPPTPYPARLGPWLGDR